MFSCKDCYRNLCCWACENKDCKALKLKQSRTTCFVCDIKEKCKEQQKDETSF